MTFLFFLKSAPWWLFSKTKLRHHNDFSPFLCPKLQSQFLGWKYALTPHLIDSDGRAYHKDSESGPNSKITKNTNMTFLPNTAELVSIPDSLMLTDCHWVWARWRNWSRRMPRERFFRSCCVRGPGRSCSHKIWTPETEPRASSCGWRSWAGIATKSIFHCLLYL